MGRSFIRSLTRSLTRSHSPSVFDIHHMLLFYYYVSMQHAFVLVLPLVFGYLLSFCTQS